MALRPGRFPNPFIASPKGVLIYADPPYDVDFREYSAEGFSFSDQVELAERLALHPGPVILSNQATPRTLALYEGLGFGIRLLKAPRRIAWNGDRPSALEVLALKNGVPFGKQEGV